jgi:hypothetical protein
MAMGSYSTKFQPERLRELINQNKTSREITKELGISSFTLKEHLLLLQRQDKKAYAIHGLLEDEEQRRRTIKFRRGIVFSPPSLVEKDFKPGDAFEMEEQEGRIILRKLT